MGMDLIILIVLLTRVWYHYSPITHNNHKMSSFKILQVNIRSLNTSKRYLEQYVDNNNINLVTLSKTWNDKSYISFKNWNCNNLFSNRATDNYGGVAILPNNGSKIVRRKDLEDDELELVWAEVEIDKTKIMLASVYIPPGKTNQLRKFEENLCCLSYTGGTYKDTCVAVLGLCITCL